MRGRGAGRRRPGTARRGTHPKTNHTDAEGDGGCSAEAYEGGKAELKPRTTPKRADAARGGDGEGTALNDRATVERQTQGRGTEAGDDAERKRGRLCGRRRRENLGEDVFRGIRGIKAKRGQEREAALTHRASGEGPTRIFEVGRGTRPKPNPTDAEGAGCAGRGGGWRR